MGSIHTCQQHRREKTISQHTHTTPYSQRYRNQKSEPAEHETFRPVLLKVLHIHLKTGKEHDVIESYFTKQFKTTVAVEHMKAVFANQHTRQNHAYNMRYMETPQNHRSKKNDN